MEISGTVKILMILSAVLFLYSAAGIVITRIRAGKSGFIRSGSAFPMFGVIFLIFAACYFAYAFVDYGKSAAEAKAQADDIQLRGLAAIAEYEDLSVYTIIDEEKFIAHELSFYRDWEKAHRSKQFHSLIECFLDITLLLSRHFFITSEGVYYLLDKKPKRFFARTDDEDKIRLYRDSMPNKSFFSCKNTEKNREIFGEFLQA